MRDKEKKKEYDRMYSKKHRDRKRETSAAWRANHPKKTKEYYQKYRESIRDWRRKNREKINKYYKEIWNPKNKDKLKLYGKRYRGGPGGQACKAYNKKYHVQHAVWIRRRHGVARIENKKRNMEWLLHYLNIKQLSCRRCGYGEHGGSIDSHHLNPYQKESSQDSFGRWVNCPHEYFTKKILSANVVFLCKNCHYSLHGGVWKIEELGEKK